MILSLKQDAIRLRKTGLFYSEISNQLGISKSTAYLWTKNALLSKHEELRLANKYQAMKSDNIEKMITRRRSIKSEREKVINLKAIETVEGIELTAKHKQVICACLFWCEGAKNVSSGITFINSDPVMIQTFLKFFRESFLIDEKKFRALVHLHDYHNADHQQLYWSGVTNIPLNQFHKPYLKPHTAKNKRPGYPGCLSLRYLDSRLGNLLKMIYIEFSKSI